MAATAAPIRDDRPSQARRAYHQFTFYGFLLCFAATCVATVYHYALRAPAPYPFWSLPTLLGTVGGGALLIGPAGLLWLKARRDPALASEKQTGMDVGFLALLLLVSSTGLLLLALRESAAMGMLLAVHLGAVMALFITLAVRQIRARGLSLYRAGPLLRGAAPTFARTGRGIAQQTGNMPVAQ